MTKNWGLIRLGLAKPSAMLTDAPFR